MTRTKIRKEIAAKVPLSRIGFGSRGEGLVSDPAARKAGAGGSPLSSSPPTGGKCVKRALLRGKGDVKLRDICFPTAA